ncbi:hypothetical protein [Maribacter stanieri]|uniref:Uncharacterized protein n=1 Tax=Maribacter stanieri TaxID=440514 RepID=A0A1I6IC87_9FLAO|nr:hypothetical protein [Maribacter stanieri]SFR64229.1 hypothetical protein SAMN04488010_1454 [Maribacter stanieri]
MTDIDKQLFLEHFIPTELEGKRKVMFENGSSITTKYKSEFKYFVKYLPGNYADYYSPEFIFKTDNDLKIKITPIPNFYTFIFIPIALVIMNYYENLENENIWTIVIALILFVIFVQFVLIIPSLLNIRKRVNEK